MSVTLPYNFNTAQTGRIISVALAATGIVIMPCLIALSVSVMPSEQAVYTTGPLLLVGLGDIVAAFFLFKKLGGATGSIDNHNVVVKADNIAGVRSGAPEGSYALSQFSAIKVQPRGDGLARLTLAGKNGTPDIIFFNGPFAIAKQLVDELSPQLNLPVEPVVKAA